MVNAVMAPHVFGYMLRAAPGPLAPIAAALSGSGDGEDAAAHLERLAAGCGVSRLSELGVDDRELPVIARLAAGRPELAATPSAPGEAEALALLRAAL
jgi:alcohol dehydrogenase class IV